MSVFLEGVVTYDLAGALKALRKEQWFTTDSFNTRVKNYKLYGYEQRDQPSPLKKDVNKERLTGNAMSLMVLLRNVFIKATFFIRIRK
jgi:hypothetical protein